MKRFWKRFAWVAVGILVLFSNKVGVEGQESFPSPELHGGAISLKAVTYNIQIGKNAAGDLDLERTIDELKELEADIIGLQEVERYSPRSGLKDQAKQIGERLGLEYRFAPALKIGPFEYGNLLLSRYPIEALKVIPLPSGREERAALLATLNIHGRQVAVAVTHLGLNHEERIGHVNILQQEFAAVGLPLIVIGDFNTTPDSEELGPWTQNLQHVSRVPLVTLPAAAKQIDSILISREFSVGNVFTVQSDASDHYPLVARLELP
ncbi:endonuclease/exonuclease/phosphatase family metal-dependent hydrolase [Tumebacillus sp. BK434]|uniref:endonuclease/exonuclease/phosphatase family protein n=1 Tax=Tumebacillus sp. BK434 TaxID=2512169 RepID=UPI00104AC8FB|nr:endonuclease/exonuclease/phosphatase family protein [Tumebacillus sp. BK434]TCP59553.1 endonuclease/exonuclease/phosphatase family metal-dependent hydrolase [Tumebacillus sp. BK434]